MIVVVSVRDYDTGEWVYLQTVYTMEDIEKIYRDKMTARMIITLASLHTHRFFTLVTPFKIEINHKTDIAKVIYYVKEKHYKWIEEE